MANDTVAYSIAGRTTAVQDGPRTLYIPEGVTRVVSLKVFAPDDEYERIVFPASVEEIPDDSLHANTTVREVVFLPPQPGGCGTGLRYIGDHTFREMRSLEKVVLPPTLKEIGMYAFANCHSLREINLPSSLLSIGAGAFRGCTSLTHVTLPENLQSIGYAAFRDCSLLRKMTILGDLPIDAFDISVCHNLKSIESPFYRIEDGMLIHSRSGKLIWHMDKGATEVAIPEGVTQICESAFEGQDTIGRITLPSTLREIGQMAFAFCDRLSSIGYRDGASSHSDGEDICNHGTKSAVFPPSLRKIGEKAFTSCNGIRNLVLHKGIEQVGESAFSECFGLERIRIENPSVEMGNSVFRQCTSLLEVELPEGISTLPRCAFTSCPSLERINLPSSLSQIGDECFHGCHRLDALIPEDACIGSRAFNSCHDIRIGGGRAGYFVKDGALYDPREGSLLSVSRSCKALSIPEGIHLLNPQVIATIEKDTKCICMRRDIWIDWRKFLSVIRIPMAIFPESMAKEIGRLYAGR